MGPTKQHVFRQRSALALAAMCAVTGLFMLVSLVLDWADNPQPLFLAWLLLGLALVWSVFVRPAVLLDGQGVTVRNVVRDFHIPWDQVTDTETRWNLKVFVGDRGYTAWAITSQAERPKRGTGGMFGILSPRRLDSYTSAAAGPSTPAPAPKVTAAMVARTIEAAKQEYDEAVELGAFPAAPDTGVRVTWVPLVVAALLLPAIAVVALILL